MGFRERITYVPDGILKDELANAIKASPMARQLLSQSYFFSINEEIGWLELHIRPEHKHLLTFQKELSDQIKERFMRDDFEFIIKVIKDS